MNKDIKILLNKERSVDSVNENSKLEFNIDNTNKVLPLNDINSIVNSYEQFLIEREESSIYRFYGVLNGTVSNPLYNDNIIIYTSDTGSLTSKKVLSSEIFEKDGWIGYFSEDTNPDLEQYGDNKSSLCDFLPFDPGYNRLNMLDSDGKPNYMLKVTYPFDTEDIVLVRNSSNISLKDGIPIIQQLAVRINGRNYVAFMTPINHGLKERDSINMYRFIDNSGGNLALNDIQYNVFKLGDQNNDNKNRVFVLDIDPEEINCDPGISTVKRVVNDKESEYYVRRFKSLTDGYKDYDIYPSSFGVNYFDDNLAGFNFIKDIDVRGIKDNLGRPLSELYLTIVKNDTDAIGWKESPISTSNDLNDPVSTSEEEQTAYDGQNIVAPGQTLNSTYWQLQQSSLNENIKNNFWTKIGAGYITELIYPDPTATVDVDFKGNYNVRAIGDPNYSNNVWFTGIDESDNIFDADIVEYNTFELLERTLEDLWHRINTTYRENLNSISSTPTPSSSVLNGEFYLGGIADFYILCDINMGVHLTQGDIIGICYTCAGIDKCEEFGVRMVTGKTIHCYDPHSYLNCLSDEESVKISLAGCPCDDSSTTNQQQNKMEGYIYKPHNKIPIREYASVVNPILDLQSVFDRYNITGTTEIQQVIDAYKVPDYATQVQPYVYRWRDILEIGEVDALGSGVNYPFESGAHYLYLNNRFYLERQDPPCEFTLNSEELTFPGDKDKFLNLLTDPSFFNYSILNSEEFAAINAGGATDLLDYNNALKPIYVDVKLINLYGDYELGSRDTPGGCVSFNLLDRKDIDDVC
tara:strand:- start:338 stop:2752 length:2415 start_codon:yes stop_codon:yes gene_type:complete